MGSKIGKAEGELATRRDENAARKSTAKTAIDLSTRLALRIPEAADAVGLSEGCFRQALPEIEKVHVGKAVLIPVDALKKWLHDTAKAESESVDRAVGELLNELR